METGKHPLYALLRKGEGVALEFKESRKGLSKSVFQTLCAFLNRSGGTLLLGVNDAGKISGIVPEAVAQIRKDLVTTLGDVFTTLVYPSRRKTPS